MFCQSWEILITSSLSFFIVLLELLLTLELLGMFFMFQSSLLPYFPFLSSSIAYVTNHSKIWWLKVATICGVSWFWELLKLCSCSVQCWLGWLMWLHSTGHLGSFPEASFSMWCHPSELFYVALFSNKVGWIFLTAWQLGFKREIFFFFEDFIYLFMRDRGRSRLPPGSLMRDLIPGPRGHDLSQRQVLNYWTTQVPLKRAF